MNGDIKKSECGFCGVDGAYGGKPAHKSHCLTAGEKWDINCSCGHWGGIHITSVYSRANPYRPYYGNQVGRWGCLMEGCQCEKNCDEVSNVQIETISCVCGARKAGFPDGSLFHAHFGYSDPKKWCPARQGYHS